MASDAQDLCGICDIINVSLIANFSRLYIKLADVDDDENIFTYIL